MHHKTIPAHNDCVKDFLNNNQDLQPHTFKMLLFQIKHSTPPWKQIRRYCVQMGSAINTQLWIITSTIIYTY